ncbi:hypothetical protein [Parapedobacter tibetensis]|uniref:hypothetical protein n=1 Tax=Parapedobacter tibetensis TaxID=2972951 RepID=UPI00214D6592|nr:hypothetical protein [Parapedobacter tibetensis]
MIATNNKNSGEKSAKRKVRKAYDLSEEFNKKPLQEIIIGSDEHLDMISRETQELKKLITLIAKTNDDMENHFPRSKEIAEDIKPIMQLLHSSLTTFIGKVRNNKLIFNSFKGCIDQLEVENSQLNEYISDLNNYVISGNKVVSDDFFDN